jgi:hypothetical protein
MLPFKPVAMRRAKLMLERNPGMSKFAFVSTPCTVAAVSTAQGTTFQLTVLR